MHVSKHPVDRFITLFGKVFLILKPMFKACILFSRIDCDYRNSHIICCKNKKNHQYGSSSSRHCLVLHEEPVAGLSGEDRRAVSGAGLCRLWWQMSWKLGIHCTQLSCASPVLPSLTAFHVSTIYPTVPWAQGASRGQQPAKVWPRAGR